ncbi:MAG TPA: methionine--tRNA ligase [Thermoanaerobaculia bacterium]|nr:methionine--tRNA ligase [Thermoanaerobaculia bacterium]
MDPTFYISTAIHYVNDLPHIGHIYENVAADVIARYKRLRGYDVFFLTGTDEHGQKIERSAAKQGISPIELANSVVADHRRLWEILGISNDDFIRTTEPRHRLGVYELIQRIQERNPTDIYLSEFSGWYCSSEEAFFTESQIENGRCESGHPVERMTEQNYFFKLSRYERPLLEHYRANPDFIYPKTRFNEVVSFVEGGLKDLSVSRTTIRWGIPFPGAAGEAGHIIYVWMDALTNYISALGFGTGDDDRFQRYWPADVHLIGKDIIRFHAVYWPAFLMAAGVELPKSIVAHGWWLRDSQKISKSVGNIVRPDAIIEQFGPDPLRFFLMREMVFGQDSDYSDEAFLTRYNADLANDLGNTLSRALKMTDTYFEGKTPPVPCDDNDVMRTAQSVVPEYLSAMDRYAFQRALESVWKLLVATNGYIVSREPWKHFKEKGADESLSRILWNVLESSRLIWTMLSPFMPALSTEALRRLGASGIAIDEKGLAWGGLPNGAPVVAGEPLFPRVDTAAYFDSKPSGETVTDEKPPQPTAPDDPRAESGPPIETTEAMPPDKAKISIDQFMEVDLRVAKILAAERIEKSKKLLKLRVDDGEGERQLVAGIASRYTPEELVGRSVIIVANLAPAKLMGVESNGMVLAATVGGEPSLLAVDPSVPPGTKVK